MKDNARPQSHLVDLAHARILKWIRVTPVIRMQGPGARPVCFKLEGLQRSGSFKLRGALNKLLTLGDEAKAGVVTASGGNHALGVAWAGWLLGVPVQCCVPENTPRFKVEALGRANAKVRLVDGTYPEAEALAKETAHQQALAYVHAYDDLDVVAGQGTVIREFLSQAPDVQTLVVAVGGGGLAAGAVLAADGRRVVGIEPAGAPTMFNALKAGRPVRLEEIDSVAADALGAGIAGDVNFGICQKGLHRVNLVSDQDLRDSQSWLWEHSRLVCETGAAAGLAALSAGILDEDPGPIGVVLCGSNVDPSILTA